MTLRMTDPIVVRGAWPDPYEYATGGSDDRRREARNGTTDYAGSSGRKVTPALRRLDGCGVTRDYLDPRGNRSRALCRVTSLRFGDEGARNHFLCRLTPIPNGEFFAIEVENKQTNG